LAITPCALCGGSIDGSQKCRSLAIEVSEPRDVLSVSIEGKSRKSSPREHGGQISATWQSLSLNGVGKGSGKNQPVLPGQALGARHRTPTPNIATAWSGDNRTVNLSSAPQLISVLWSPYSRTQ